MTAIKEKLKAEIDGITDEKFLKDISELIENHQSEEVFELSENEKQVIAESRNQIKKGDIFTNEQIREMSEKWIR